MLNPNRYCPPYKSGGERLIAAYLESKDIDFSYERPIAIVDQGKTKIFHPDFYLNDYHLIVEYLGMAGNKDYDRVTEYKRLIYRENKIDVIEIFPSDFKDSWKKKIENGIYQTLERRLSDFLTGPGKKIYNLAGQSYTDHQQVPF